MSRQTFLFSGLSALCALTTTASANTVVLFGTRYDVRRFDYKQEIQWPNPVSPGNQLGLIRIEGAWALGNNRFLVSTSHQDQSVPTTYANFVLEIRANVDANNSVTGFSYVRTVVANDPVLLGSPFDLRAGGVAVNTTGFGAGAGGNVTVADGGASKMLRAYDISTGALLPLGVSGLGVLMAPRLGDFTDLTYYVEGPRSAHRLFALDETSKKIHACDLSGTVLSNFDIAGTVNPLVIPGDPKGIAYLTDVATWPTPFHGQGGVLLVSMGDQQPGLQAFTRSGIELGWEPLLSSVFQTSPTVTKPKIEAIATDPTYGRLFLFMEKGSLVDNWVWVLTPDCNENSISDLVDIQSGAEFDLNQDGLPDVCQPVGVATCIGDGSGTACPCANNAPLGSGRGCMNSLGSAARVRAVGDASLALDTLSLTGEGMPNGPVLYIQGTNAVAGGAGIVFGDGLLCTGGSVLRLKLVFNASGASHIPTLGDPTLSTSGLVSSPTSVVYQAWYRDNPAYCTGAGFNLTNGLLVTWAP